MKKFFLIFLIIFVFANLAIAQNEGAAVESSTISFIDIIRAGGILGVTIWTIILTMWPLAFILGIISTFCSVQNSNNKIPFSFKTLLLAPLFYFFVGSVGVLYGIMSCSNFLSQDAGSSKASSLAFGISNTIYTAGFTLFGMIPYMFFILVSLTILHFKKIESSEHESSNYEEDL